MQGRVWPGWRGRVFGSERGRRTIGNVDGAAGTDRDVAGLVRREIRERPDAERAPQAPRLYAGGGPHHVTLPDGELERGAAAQLHCARHDGVEDGLEISRLGGDLPQEITGGGLLLQR